MLGDLGPQDVEDVLQRGVVGRIGCISAGRAYVVPVCYVYDEGCVFGHSMPGMKMTALQENSQVCFEVEDVVDLAHWRSVIAWGSVEFLHDADAARGFKILVERLAPLFGGSPGSARPKPTGEQPPSAGVYRIRLTEKTGRFEH